ncbi:MAG: CPBP family intramembrane metalloprotease [Verrucomicrobia bacterium]|nr:CPBP family intramembrane metalloprotease [Verrucomicrobiota bacterium]
MSATSRAAFAAEIILLLGGLLLAWREALSPAARARQTPVRLSEWPLPVADFLRFLLIVVCATLAGNLAGTLVLKLWSIGTDTRAMVLTAFSQAGMLAGIGFFKASAERVAPRDFAVTPGDLAAGGAIFLVALPFVTATNAGWLWLLKTCGVELPKQELVDMFLHARAPALLAFMILLATVTAPLSEELLFRAGFFRYLRTRLPRWAALLGPACLFAALHQHVASFLPLVVLGIIFSLAYERTGRVAPVIVAHACFNLNTIVLLLCGVGV